MAFFVDRQYDTKLYYEIVGEGEPFLLISPWRDSNISAISIRVYYLISYGEMQTAQMPNMPSPPGLRNLPDKPDTVDKELFAGVLHADIDVEAVVVLWKPVAAGMAAP